MGVDMICNVRGGGGLMTIAREAREKFPPSYYYDAIKMKRKSY